LTRAGTQRARRGLIIIKEPTSKDEMTGIFTYKSFSLRDTPALDGKVAVVTVSSTISVYSFSFLSPFSSAFLFLQEYTL
jgi:hypothetical protein